MKDAESMAIFLEKCLDQFLSMPADSQAFWLDHPLEYLSSCLQSEISFALEELEK